MRAKYLAAVELVIILFLSSTIIAQCVSLKKGKSIVRAPAAPGESTLSYTPPPPAKFPLEAVKQALEMRDFIKPHIDRITDDIYLARGFALGSVQMVITGEGLVIIDTTESADSAKEIFAEFRKITDKPVRYIIYTHSHLDHTQGASVFMQPGIQVIATNDAVLQMKKDYGWLKEFVIRSRLNQAGLAAPEYSKKLPVSSPVRSPKQNIGLVWPTITFDNEYSFTLGGRKFELYHTWGETPDHLMVWMPDEKALFCGDLYYSSFPNLSTPMLEQRPVREWYESLDRMISMKPKYLIPGHTAAITGEQQITDTLTNYSKAIRYVYEETIRGINEGKTEDDLAHSIKLPEELAKLPYLQELYGRVDWSVRGIYRNLTGWYDGHGTGLNPLPAQIRAREIVALAGGADKILERAIELQKAGEHQLACELCDIIIAANPKDKLAHAIKANSLDYIGVANFNINMFGFYRSAEALERKAAGVSPAE